MSGFQPGQEVYTPNGERAVYVGQINGQHYVRRLMAEYDNELYDDMWPEEHAVAVSRVFASEPQAVLGEETRRAQARLDEIRATLAHVRRELKEADARRAEARKAADKYPDLSTALDFIEGRIAYLAITDSYYSTAPSVVGFNEFMQDREGYYGDKGMRLLCLFGTNGHGKQLNWAVNRYRDDSGEWFTAVPCKSHEEAVAAVRQAFAAALGEWRGDNSKGYLVERFRKCNVPLEWPQDYQAWKRETEARRKAERITRLRAELKELLDGDDE